MTGEPNSGIDTLALSGHAMPSSINLTEYYGPFSAPFSIPDATTPINRSDNGANLSISSSPGEQNAANVTLAVSSSTEEPVTMAGEPLVLYAQGRENASGGIKPRRIEVGESPDPFYYGRAEDSQITFIALGEVGDTFAMTNGADYGSLLKPDDDLVAQPPISRRYMAGDLPDIVEAYQLADGTLLTTFIEGLPTGSASIIVDGDSEKWNGKLLDVSYAVQRGDADPEITRYLVLPAHSDLYGSSSAEIQVKRPGDRVQLGLPVAPKEPSSLANADPDLVFQSVKAVSSDHNRKAWAQLLETETTLPTEIKEAIKAGLKEPTY